MMDYLTRNFLVISSGVTVASAAMVMVVLSGYLAAFDWSLIWLVEYTDLLKLFLIGAAILAGSASLISQLFEAFFAFRLSDRKARFGAVSVTVIFTLVLAVNLWIDWRHPKNSNVPYHITAYICTIMLAFVVYHAGRRIRGEFSGGITLAVIDITGSMVILFFIGLTYGSKVSGEEGGQHTLFIKSSTTQKIQKVEQAKIIMITSHHIVVLVNKVVQTYQTPDIVSISYGSVPQSSESTSAEPPR